MSEPSLDLNKKRERRQLGPGGQWLEKKDAVLLPTYRDPRPLHEVIGKSKQLVKHKAAERFRSMNPLGSLPRGFPENRSQFLRACKTNDQDALKYLIRFVMLEQGKPGDMYLYKPDSIEITFDYGESFPAYTAKMLLTIDKKSPIEVVRLNQALGNPGSPEWDSLVVHLPSSENFHFWDTIPVVSRSEKVLSGPIQSKVCFVQRSERLSGDKYVQPLFSTAKDWATTLSEVPKFGASMWNG